VTGRIEHSLIDQDTARRGEILERGAIHCVSGHR
jgi:hypothetical protein